jgi:hypothetical protein
VKGGGKFILGIPPADTDKDWVAIVKPGTAGKAYSSFGGPAKAKPGQPMTLSAIKDFEFVVGDGFVPGYIDKGRKALAINAAQHQNKFAAAEGKYKGKPGKYDLVLNALTETDGESTYRVLIAGKKIGEATNPETTKDYEVAAHRFDGVELKTGDTIRIEFSTASNGKIPEGEAFAFSRGRWRSVQLLKPRK